MTWRTLFLVILAALVSVPSAAEPKFRPLSDSSAAFARYRVTLSPSGADDPGVIIRQLLAAFRGRIEPYAEEGFTGFILVTTGEWAGRLSADPRVRTVEELAPSPREAVSAQPVKLRAPGEHAPRPPQTIQTNETGSTWSVGPYAYDGSGNIKSIGRADGTTDTFVYDAFGRLSSGTAGAGKRQEYTYDDFGNILTITTDGSTANMIKLGVDPATNRISRTSDAASQPYNAHGTYDDAGNMVATSLGDSFVYDGLGMLKESTVAGSRKVYLYTAGDERIASIAIVNDVRQGGNWTLRDPGGAVLRRYYESPSRAWSWSEDYIYADGRLLAAEVNAPEKTLHFFPDHLGTPRLITGDGGAEFVRRSHYPFGRETAREYDDYEAMDFTGHERDAAMLTYMHARSYLPSWGRFLSVDPVLDIKAATSNPQGWNRYAYVRNNPVRFTDPTGRYQCEGSKGDCAAIKQAWQDLRKAASNLPRGSSERGSVNQVLSFLGRPGQQNGVTVTIGRGMIERTSGGATINTHSAPVGPTGFTFQLGLDLNRIALSHGGRNSAAFAPEVAAALGHEGQHGIDLGRAGRMFQFESQVSESETNAYTLDAAVYRGLNFESSWGLWTRSGGINQQAIDDAVAQSVTDWLTERLRQ